MNIIITFLLITCGLVAFLKPDLVLNLQKTPVENLQRDKAIAKYCGLGLLLLGFVKLGIEILRSS